MHTALWHVEVGEGSFRELFILVCAEVECCNIDWCTLHDAFCVDMYVQSIQIIAISSTPKSV